MIRQSKLDFVCEIKPGTPVIWWRDGGRYDGVSIRPNLKGQPWERYFPERAADDLSAWLAVFLTVPHLADALKIYLSPRECQPGVTEPLPPPVAPVALPPTVEQLPENVGGALPFQKPLEATLHRLKAKQAREKTGHNGTH